MKTGTRNRDKNLAALLEEARSSLTTKNERVEVNFHSFQAELMSSTKRFLFAIAGKQGGKTHLGKFWLWKRIADYQKDDHMICAPTYKILNQATLPRFRDVMEGTLPGKWNEAKMEFVLNAGGRVFVRSTDDPDSIEAMTLRSIWADELGRMKYAVWDKFIARLSFLKGSLLGTTSWYSQNWLYHEIFKKRAEDPDFKIVKWRSVDSPYFPKDEYERIKKIHTSATGELSSEFKRDYDAECTKSEGLVYKVFDRSRHVIDSIQIKPEWHRFNGIDLGYNAPTVVVACAIDNQGTIYVYDEYRRSEAVMMSHAAEIEKRGWKQVETYADKSAQQEIAELRQFGINVSQNTEIDVNVGISRLNQLLMKNRIKITSNCTKLIDEFESYSWKQTTDYDDPVDKVVKKHDHALDALRYAITSTRFMLPNARNPKFYTKPRLEFDETTGAIVSFEVDKRDGIMDDLINARPMMFGNGKTFDRRTGQWN